MARRSRLEGHGSEELKRRYLPKMIDGTWSGTMCLTEAQCGTDLGMMRTKAVPQADGSYKISGCEDLHLRRRARPDREHHPPGAGAPAGCAEGHQGRQHVPGAEIRAQRGWPAPARATASTCAAHRAQDGAQGFGHLQLYFDDATGWLVGEPQQGHARHVHHDERRAAVGRHPGSGRRRDRLPERRLLREGPHPGPCVVRCKIPRACRRSDHRAPRRAPHADDGAGLCRRLPRALRLGRARSSIWKPRHPTRSAVRRPRISSP